MKRKTFLSLLGLASIRFPYSTMSIAQSDSPETFYFKDDGKIPNSKYPLLVYRNAFTERNQQGASWLEKRFADNNWTNSWRNGVYAFHHYHSTSHEVLGVYSGKALLHLGGENGQKINVQAGDILVIPAGVGHKNLGSENLGIVGAYPDGREWDVNRGLAGERPQTDKNIAALPIPATDPLLGKTAGLPTIWRS
ncbi:MULTISPECIES: cupin domain-containing protein [Spirosoma]|uniref:Cupin domain-containing protein n=1 Tax=Spirosoma liriopis TaxID=2937440 RepID=A0ABT0HMZ8_9BACT|nr:MULTISPECIES: cupin domain-containing protein [Spirosoma]MCK8493345.1 cupin domain-containing protein [Spirosoma liriopis]UHG92733.1 cupin domain-containing protein [Spirosoma oryzicola]